MPKVEPPRWDLANSLDTIVLTTGHSGSKALASALSRAGEPAGHECVFRLNPRRPCDKVPGDITTEVAWTAYYHLDDLHERMPGVRYLHLVRDPLLVYESMVLTMPRHGPHVRYRKHYGEFDMHGYDEWSGAVLAYMQGFYDSVRGMEIPTMRIENPYEVELTTGVPGVATALYSAGPRINQHKQLGRVLDPSEGDWYSRVRAWRITFGYE